MTAFEILLSELERSCGLSQDQLNRVRDIFRSWQGQRVYVRGPKASIAEDARKAARRMIAERQSRPVIRDRLMAMGVSRRRAYVMIADALQDRVRHALP